MCSKYISYHNISYLIINVYIWGRDEWDNGGYWGIWEGGDWGTGGFEDIWGTENYKTKILILVTPGRGEDAHQCGRSPCSR